MNQPVVSVAHGLNLLARARSKDVHKWVDVLRSVTPQNAKYATGKEVALILNSLTHTPAKLRCDTLFVSIVHSTGTRGVSLVTDSMNEKSIAIAALAIVKLQDVLPSSLVGEFGERLCSVFEKRRMRFPQNVAQVAYAISLANPIPVGVKSDALKSWIKHAVLATSNQMHVKDIVQVMKAYAHMHCGNAEVMEAMEKSILRQIQYMDSISISAVSVAFAKLRCVPCQEVIDALVATIAQCVGEMNSQSVVSMMYAISCWASERILLDTHAVDAIINRASVLVKSNTVPVPSLVVLVRAVNSLGFVDAMPLRRAVEQLDLNTSESPSLIGELALEVFKMGSKEISSRLVAEHIFPLLGKGSDIPHITRLLEIIAKISPDLLTQSVDLSDLVTRLHGSASVRCLGTLLEALVEAHVDPSISESILLHIFERPDWDHELSTDRLEMLAVSAWRSSGEIPLVLRDAISKRQDFSSYWLSLPRIHVPEGSRVISIESDISVTGGVQPPPPGIKIGRDEEKSSRIFRWIEALDPMFSLSLGNVIFQFCPAPSPRPSDVSLAVAALATHRVGTSVVLIPSDNLVDESLAIQILDKFAS